MSLELTQLLDVSTSGLTLITTDNANNSSFVLPAILLAKVKEMRSLPAGSGGPAIVLITLDQSYTHFASVLARCFGLNLKTYKDNGQLVTLDLLKDLSHYLQDGKIVFDALEEDILKAVSSLGRSNRSFSSLIIIDDISLLHTTLGVPHTRVYHLILRIWSSISGLKCHLVIQSHLFHLGEELGSFDSFEKIAKHRETSTREESQLWSKECALIYSLSSLACNWLNFYKLPTGYSINYNGCFTCLSKKVDTICQNVIQVDSKRYLFKNQERNTKIFAPGFND